jgi:hypothetical protein
VPEQESSADAKSHSYRTTYYARIPDHSRVPRVAFGYWLTIYFESGIRENAREDRHADPE